MSDSSHPTPDFDPSWRRAWQGAGARTDGAEIRDALIARYNETHRKYHTLQHLSECLDAFNAVQMLPAHPAEVELAIWFHDAVYDVHGSDNEERSAKWAEVALLQADASPDIAARVATLILATKHTALPTSRDEQVLVDIDLSILAAGDARFAEYERQIRDEYAFVPGPLFHRTRSAILKSFLDRPRIYSTAHFHTALEEAARANLHRAIGKHAG